MINVMEKVVGAISNNGLLAQKLPNYSERESQIELVKAIYNSYIEGNNLVAEAPTGIGKSIAGLIPAIFSASECIKTVITTSTKALQMQYYEKDLPFLCDVFGGTFTYAMLKGRSNYICMKRLEEYYNEHVVKGDMKNLFMVQYQYDEIKKWLNTTETGDLEELPFEIEIEMKTEICSDSDECEGKKCSYACSNCCYYRKAKEKAHYADIVLVNTDLFCVDLTLRNKHNASVLPDYHSVIIDEAHELEDIFSKYVGFKVSHNSIKNAIGFAVKFVNRLKKEFCGKSHIEDLVEDIKRFDEQLVVLSKASISFFDNFIFDLSDGKDVVRISGNDIDTATIVACKKLLKAIENTCNKLPNVNIYSDSDVAQDLYEKVNKRFVDLSLKIENITKIHETENEYVYWVSYTKKGIPVIECCPIDVSHLLNEWLFNRKMKVADWDRLFLTKMQNEEADITMPIRNVVIMSATLTTNKSFYFITERLGIYDYKSTILPHSFDYSHNALLYIPKGLVEPNINKNGEIVTIQLANNIIALSNITEGKMLCLFTSYAEMERVFNIVKREIGSKYNIFNQNQYPKSELVRMFKEDINSILFATSSFWTGVDFQGETLSALVIDKIPFPVPSDPIIEARIDKIKSKRGDWFNTYYVPMATMDMCQGFGRLIRTKTDMGIVMICDKRIISKPYGKKFINSFPPTLQTNNIEKVKVFYDIVKRKREIHKKKWNKNV